MFDDGNAFPFFVGKPSQRITDIHPPVVQIFQLWHIYLNNINPLLKITHTPTLQGKIIEAVTNLQGTPKETQALLFAVYFTAIGSLSEDECITMFHQAKRTLLGKYHNALQHALLNAEFMRTNNIVVLQAYLLYLVCIYPFLTIIISAHY